MIYTCEKTKKSRNFHAAIRQENRSNISFFALRDFCAIFAIFLRPTSDSPNKFEKTWWLCEHIQYLASGIASRQVSSQNETHRSRRLNKSLQFAKRKKNCTNHYSLRVERKAFASRKCTQLSTRNRNFNEPICFPHNVFILQWQGTQERKRKEQKS